MTKMESKRDLAVGDYKSAPRRLATFKGKLPWPHDHPSAELMVAAGFFFDRREDSDDMATCPACECSIDSWDPTDDPFEEHLKENPGCGFALSLKEDRKAAETKASAEEAKKLVAQVTASALACAVAAVGPAAGATTTARFAQKRTATTGKAAAGKKRQKRQKQQQQKKKTAGIRRRPTESAAQRSARQSSMVSTASLSTLSTLSSQSPTEDIYSVPDLP